MNSVTEYDKIRFMHCAILQSDEISVPFRLFVRIFFLIQHFVSYCFLQLLIACKDRCSHKILKRLTFTFHIISKQNILDSIKGVLVADMAN